MVLKVIIGSRRSFSASEMEAQFGHKEDRVTIYRIFNDLHARGIIARFVDIDGVARYVHHPGHPALHPNSAAEDAALSWAFQSSRRPTYKQYTVTKWMKLSWCFPVPAKNA